MGVIYQRRSFACCATVGTNLVGTARRRFALTAILGLVATFGSSHVTLAAGACAPPAAGVMDVHKPLPNLERAWRAHETISVVAFGSSSTAGTGASGPDRSYPARLKYHLSQKFPKVQFSVANKGRGGELARHMLARLDRDVLKLKPQLVLWQTGVNDAIKQVDPEEFRTNVELGIERFKAAGIDVILIDQQYFPGSSKVPGYGDYLELLHRIGEKYNVPVFRRYELMAHLVRSAQFDLRALLAPDRFHQNDTSYECMGAVLAQTLQASLSFVK